MLKKTIILSILTLCLYGFSRDFVMIMSDSTAVDYRGRKNYHKLPWTPMSGWGEHAKDNMKKGVPLLNWASGGYSSKTYFESRFPSAKRALRRGGWLLLSFGSNDVRPHPKWDRVTKADTTYKEYLDKMASAAVKAGLKVVLISPPPYYMSSNGKFNNPVLAPYAKATRELAAEKKYYFIDLFNILSDKFKNMSDAEVRTHYMFLKRGDSPNWPNGAADILHFTDKGSKLIWQICFDSIKKDIPELAKFFK